VSKLGWAFRRQTSLTKAYKNVFPDTSPLIPALTILRSSLNMYVFFVGNKFVFSLLALLRAHHKLLSE
jgi:hypothetical protein